MTLRAVFIDAGNTLLYEKPSRFEIYAQAARRRGLPTTEDDMHGLMRRAHRELPREIDGAWRYSEAWFSFYIERIFHDYLDLAKDELPGVAEELFARFAAPETFGLHAGARELLEALRHRGLRVGIVSNWSARLPGLVERLGIAGSLDFVLASAIERAEKPEPEIFERALARAGVAPAEALHAGDDVEKDVLGPRRVGIRAVLVDRSAPNARSDANRSHEVERVQDLFELAALIGRTS
jgi:putative hydrolase of the HAD superfamily